jgi:hypothetical protein
VYVPSPTLNILDPVDDRDARRFLPAPWTESVFNQNQAVHGSCGLKAISGPSIYRGQGVGRDPSNVASGSCAARDRLINLTPDQLVGEVQTFS